MAEFQTIGKAAKQTKLSYLGNINSSAKLMKNKKVSGQYTYIIYLAPAKSSGYNVCSHSTAECRKGCLATSGRAGMEIICGGSCIHNARIKKTRLFFEDTAFFMQWMIAEIKRYQKKALKDNFGFSVRLNGTSDIDWANVIVDGKNIFQLFPEVTFYDYTKNPNKFNHLPLNYHLTMSYTGRNANVCEALLEKGFNVAVVFNVKKKKPLPETFFGYKVVDGDLTDYRPDDGKGVIIGLRFKLIADRQAAKELRESVFVVDPANVQHSMSNVPALVTI
jgi:hypothetical protein